MGTGVMRTASAMTVAAAEAIVLALAIYAGVGAVFAIIFVTALASRLDAQAKGMPIQARLLIFWGAAGLWPLLALKFIRGEKTE